MKKSITYLLLTQAIVTVFAIATNASIYSMMFLYAIQTALWFLVTTGRRVLSKVGVIYKLFAIANMLVFVPMLGFLFFALVKLPTTPVSYNNGPASILDLGSLSILTLVMGGIIFLIHYVLDVWRNRDKQPLHSFGQYMYDFLIFFAQMAGLILLQVIAVAAASDFALSIVMIAFVKTSIDVGQIVLANSFQKMDSGLTRVMPSGAHKRKKK